MLVNEQRQSPCSLGSFSEIPQQEMLFAPSSESCFDGDPCPWHHSLPTGVGFLMLQFAREAFLLFSASHIQTKTLCLFGHICIPEPEHRSLVSICLYPDQLAHPPASLPLPHLMPIVLLSHALSTLKFQHKHKDKWWQNKRPKRSEMLTPSRHIQHSRLLSPLC